jgi:hypothetical protein
MVRKFCARQIAGKCRNCAIILRIKQIIGIQGVVPQLLKRGQIPAWGAWKCTVCRKKSKQPSGAKTKMKKIFKSIALASVAGTLFLGTTDVMAQGQKQRGGGQGNFDPAQFQQQQMERLQQTLGMSADEFKAVQPLIEAVQAKQREVPSGRGGGGGFGGRAGRGQGQGQGADATPGAGGGRGRGFGGTPSPELEALQKAVESGTPAEIKAKLEAFRAVRKQKEGELQEAREKLRKVLSQKQEAALVLSGTLN